MCYLKRLEGKIKTIWTQNAEQRHPNTSGGTQIKMQWQQKQTSKDISKRESLTREDIRALRIKGAEQSKGHRNHDAPRPLIQNAFDHCTRIQLGSNNVVWITNLKRNGRRYMALPANPMHRLSEVVLVIQKRRNPSGNAETTEEQRSQLTRIHHDRHSRMAEKDLMDKRYSPLTPHFTQHRDMVNPAKEGETATKWNEETNTAPVWPQGHNTSTGWKAFWACNQLAEYAKCQVILVATDGSCRTMQGRMDASQE